MWFSMLKRKLTTKPKEPQLRVGHALATYLDLFLATPLVLPLSVSRPSDTLRFVK